MGEDGTEKARIVALDNPVERISDDEFNRWPFSQRLAETIAAFDASQGAPVFGLFGEWGEGKSSVLNFVRIALESHHPNDVTVFLFNPWMFSDVEALLREFYKGLAASAGGRLNSPETDVVKNMLEYASLLKFVPMVGDALAESARDIGTAMARDPIHEQRERLIKVMRELKGKIVVLIDDLDRLEGPEIMIMLRSVRLSANFPNVVYLLAFDDKRVARIASQAYGEPADSRAFLEKIVQHPVTLPSVPPARLAAYVLKQAKEACAAAGIELHEEAWNEFAGLCRGPILDLISTPRQAIRYSTALHFALPILKGEVDPLGQLVLEAVRMLLPDLYEWLRRQHSLDVERALNAVSATEKEMPPAKWETMKALATALASPMIEKPLSDPRYYARNFSYAVALDDISDVELEDLVQRAEQDKDKLDQAVMSILEARGRSLIERLRSRAKRMRPRPAAQLATSLGRCAGRISGDDKQDEYGDLSNVIAELVRVNSIWDASILSFGRQPMQPAREVMETAPLPLALAVVNSIRKAERQEKTGERYGNREDQFPELPVQGKDVLEDVLARRLAREAETTPPYGSYHSRTDAYALIKFWNSQDKQEQRTWLEARLGSHPKEVFHLLNVTDDMSITYGLLTGAWNNFPIRIIDAEVVIRTLDVLPPDGPEAMTSEEEVIAQGFREVHERFMSQKGSGY